MAYNGLNEFIAVLEKSSELHRIKTFVNPELEITEVADRVTKSGGKALLFENTGTAFPLLINAFGSDTRMAMATGRKNIDEAASDITRLFEMLTTVRGSMIRKLSVLPDLIRISQYLPVRSRKRGECQENVMTGPDLGIFPVLKCWPYDGGRFFTLPMVHTIHPETGKPNLGMYRMQILGRDTTAMHWQRHKTGAVHFDAWKKTGKRMPVAITLGGDPVYTYCATAPLPENVDEYILAGFLRRKKVKLVKCITNELFVPADSDIVIEGFVDPAEDLVTEGPFGDHTGFYSLSDQYPVFHTECITYRDRAVYPATIVGIPPQEDAWFARMTEKIFLPPIRIAIQPEITDLHMPDAGVAHNLVIVKINKSYPGQGMKVISSLSGAGQMMFTKYLIVVSGDVDIRNYTELLTDILKNTDFGSDCIFMKGPLDVLDHTSDVFSFGGKAGIDATGKLPEELLSRRTNRGSEKVTDPSIFTEILNVPFIKSFNVQGQRSGLLIAAVNPSEDPDSIGKLCNLFQQKGNMGSIRLVIAIDHTVAADDLRTVAWQVLGNSDPVRDHYFISESILLIDGTIKYYGNRKFPRRWPNVVCSDENTIRAVDLKWNQMGFDGIIHSPSLIYRKLVREGTDEIES
jgi:4-hydroxy-3-polyprenylbenzoate decarboxylase